MHSIHFPIGLILIAGGLVLPIIPQRFRAVLLLGLPMLVLALVLQLPHQTYSINFLGANLHWLHYSQFGVVFGVIFSIMAFVGNLYALKHASRLELSAAMIYSGSAIGVVLSGDFFTLFIFWELLAIGSTLVIWSNKTKQSYRAGLRYLFVHLLGGVILMIGIAGYYAATGQIGLTHLTTNS